MEKLYFLLLSLLIITTAQGQSQSSPYDNRGISILAGYNQGYYGFAELGLARNRYTFHELPMAVAEFISSEVKVNDTKVIGPKVGVWMSAYICSMGLNLIDYTDFHKSTFVFRPEIGLGVGPAKLVYGYNARITNSLDGINRHQLGIAWCFRVWREKDSNSGK